MTAPAHPHGGPVRTDEYGRRVGMTRARLQHICDAVTDQLVGYPDELGRVTGQETLAHGYGDHGRDRDWHPRVGSSGGRLVIKVRGCERFRGHAGRLVSAELARIEESRPQEPPVAAP